MASIHPRLNVDTVMPVVQSVGMNMVMNVQTEAIGDMFYGMQQGPAHGRKESATSPSIVFNGPPHIEAIPSGRYVDRDFIHRGPNQISLQGSDELDHSGLDFDLITRVSRGFNIQFGLPTHGPNMEGITALRVGLTMLCQTPGRVPPTDIMLLNYLEQQVSRICDDSTPRVRMSGIDRPLRLEHLLMIVHRYGLRNNEQYNLGIIRPSPEPIGFGAAATYTISFEGPKTPNSRTVWLFETAGFWYPLAPDNVSVATKTFADVLKTPANAGTQRPVTPSSSNTGLQVPDYSPSTQHTPSEIGSDITGATSLSCRSCGKKFDAQPDLAHHVRNHRHRTLVCNAPRCAKTFLYHKDLKRHEKTHTDKETRMDYVCTISTCNKAYTRQDNLRRHQRQDHPNYKPPPQSVTSSRGRHGPRFGL